MTIELPAGFFFYLLGALIMIAIISALLLKFSDRYLPRFAAFMRRYRFRAIISALILLLLTMLLVPIMLLPINPGQVGVLWKRFGGGTMLGEPFNEGTVLVFPWDQLTIYSSRFKTIEIPVEAVTIEGLKINLNMVVRYRAVRSNIPTLHKLIGEAYANILIIPEVGSSVRLMVSGYTAEQVYADKREEIQTYIFNDVNTALRLNERQLIRDENAQSISQLVYLEDVLIRAVVLPEKVDRAIVSKVNQKYLDEEYLIRLQVAKKEAQRKEIEAEGIAAFQAKVAGGISETYLRWRGIEATLELAKSHNAKVVVIGSGKDGLPLILNTESSQPPPLPFEAQKATALLEREKNERQQTKTSASTQVVSE